MRSPGRLVEKLRNVADELARTAEGVFAVDHDHRIIFWNRAAERLLGHCAEEVVGRYCHDIIQGQDCAGRRICSPQCPAFVEAKDLRRVHRQALHTCTKQGNAIRLNISTLPLLPPPREVFFLVHVFRRTDGTRRSLAGRDVPAALDPSSGSTFRADSTRFDCPDVDEKTAPLPLRPSELRVLHHLAEGLSTKEIAALLVLSPKTVRNHVDNILRKLQVHSRLEATLWAVRRRLI